MPEPSLPRRLLIALFAGAQRPWWRDPRLARHAGPDLVAAASCLAMLVPVWAYSSLAQGMAMAVQMQAILCFVDLPIVFVTAFLASPRIPRWLVAVAVLIAYTCISLAFLIWMVTAGGSALDAALWTFLLLPIGLRIAAMIAAVREGETAAAMALLSMLQIVPWMLTVTLVAMPLAAFAGLETKLAGSSAVEIHPPAWNAMGVAHFSIVALMRWVAALHATPAAAAAAR